MIRACSTTPDMRSSLPRRWNCSPSSTDQMLGRRRAGQRRPTPVREPIVHATAECLLDVVEDLCTYAGLLLLSGRCDRGEVLIEQAAELLAHRAQVLLMSRSGTGSGRSPIDAHAGDFIWGARWTN